MSATEVIELYDALLVQEQRIVAEYIRKNAIDQTTEPKPEAKFKELVSKRERLAWTLTGIVLVLFFGLFMTVAFVALTS